MNNSEITLDRLPIGRRAKVVSLTSGGAVRQRMLDLGIIKGTEIEPVHKSPSGNPVAYMIRGTVIALREDVSRTILMSGQ